MARNSADVIEHAIQEQSLASDDPPEASHELPLTAAEDPRWDDDREATYAADFEQLAPWHAADLSESDSPEWEETQTAYFERTANFELLDARFVSEYTDRLPGGLRDLVASNAESENPNRKSGVRESARALSGAGSRAEAAADSFDREHSEHFAYEVSPSLRRSAPAVAPRVQPAVLENATRPRRRTGSETIRGRGRDVSTRPAPASPEPVAVAPESLEFDEVSVATARGGRRFAPARSIAPQPSAAASEALPVRPTLRSPAVRHASWPVAAHEPVPVHAAASVPAPSQAPMRNSRPSHPGALPLSGGFEEDLAELRAARRGRAATWVWFSASALAGIALVLVVRAWTTGSLTVHEAPQQPSVAVETTVSAAAQQPTETGFSITSLPEGAQIIVDGRTTGFVTPAQIRALSAGLHSVELKLAGHYDTSLPAVVKDNEVLDLASVTLRPHTVEPLTFASAAPVGAIVPKKLSAREARLARREARRAARHTRAIARNAPVRGLTAPEDRDATVTGEGTLRINSRPWARVLIDNKFVGNTPQRSLRVAVGDHTVRLINEPLSMSKSFRVTIRDGETLTRVELLSDESDQSESQAHSSSASQAFAHR